MYYRRDIDSVLLQWKDSRDRKPLILRGARQTGKSSSVRRFGREFDLFLELNLERFEDRRLVGSCRHAEDLLDALTARENLARFPDSCLLFLDEIQEVPEAIAWLRFLYEDHPELSVIAAGSLLEVQLDRGGFSFPVGRVTFRTLRPMSFFEFLDAANREVLAGRLRDAALGGEYDAIFPFHEETLDLLRDYLMVGGLPEAVCHWVEDGEANSVGRVHADLWQALAEDIHKYRSADDLDDLLAAFDSLKFHYGLRFRYENFAPGFKSKRMQAALSKLEAAHLASRVLPTSSLGLPLAHRQRSAAKLLPLDVGLALYGMGTNVRQLRTRSLDKVLDGRLAEMFVGQQLLAGNGQDEPVFFWVSESASGNAEVDFLATSTGIPTPVEVKSGASGSLKSMHQFLSRAARDLGVRFHSGLPADEALEVGLPEGNLLRYRLLSLPLYLAELLPEVLENLND